MSPEELAEFLRLGRTFTYRLLAEGEIPCARIGRLRRVRRTDAEKFVEARMEYGGPDAAQRYRYLNSTPRRHARGGDRRAGEHLQARARLCQQECRRCGQHQRR